MDVFNAALQIHELLNSETPEKWIYFVLPLTQPRIYVFIVQPLKTLKKFLSVYKMLN